MLLKHSTRVNAFMLSQRALGPAGNKWRWKTRLSSHLTVSKQLLAIANTLNKCESDERDFDLGSLKANIDRNSLCVVGGG